MDPAVWLKGNDGVKWEDDNIEEVPETGSYYFRYFVFPKFEHFVR